MQRLYAGFSISGLGIPKVIMSKDLMLCSGNITQDKTFNNHI